MFLTISRLTGGRGVRGRNRDGESPVGAERMDKLNCCLRLHSEYQGPLQIPWSCKQYKNEKESKTKSLCGEIGSEYHRLLRFTFRHLSFLRNAFRMTSHYSRKKSEDAGVPQPMLESLSKRGRRRQLWEAMKIFRHNPCVFLGIYLCWLHCSFLNSLM